MANLLESHRHASIAMDLRSLKAGDARAIRKGGRVRDFRRGQSTDGIHNQSANEELSLVTALMAYE